jgi:hypothetical protein
MVGNITELNYIHKLKITTYLYISNSQRSYLYIYLQWIFIIKTNKNNRKK